jgi:hypothetical protein
LRRLKVNFKDAARVPLGRQQLPANWNGSVSGEVRDTDNLTLMRTKYPSRILAVDIRSRRFGYAVLEMPARLLDSGITRVAYPEIATTRIASLCKMFQPSLIVLRKEANRHGRKYPKAVAVRHALRSEAARRCIPVVALKKREVQNWFRQHGSVGKYAIAAFLADHFLELSWKLPPRRKPWHPEPWSFSLFDAIALGVVYAQSISDEEQVALRAAR